MISTRRIIIILSIVFSLFVTTPIFAMGNLSYPKQTVKIIQANKIDINAPASPVNTLKIEAQVTKKQLDQREVTLFNFLTKRHSPLATYATDFVKVADKYQLDYRFLPAISGLESSWGSRLLKGSANPFGWGGGYIYFSSFPDAFETVGNGIRTRYVRSGKVTPAQVGPTYAASPTWAVRVHSLMMQISNEPI